MARVKLEDTLFINDFYPFKEATELTIAFAPAKLIQSSAIRKFCESHKDITDQQTMLLDYMFGDTSSIIDTFEHEEDIENEDYEPEMNWFHRNAAAEMLISETGKGDDRAPFYWMRVPLSKPQLASALNFMFYSNGNFYGIQPTPFVSQVRSTAYNQETRKYDEDLLKKMFDNFDGEDYYESGYDILNDMRFKCSKSSLSKVLIAILPQLKMEQIVELSDFINTEMLAKKSAAEVGENIFELKGELITYFYNVKNYYYPKEGTLGNSCMRYDNTTEQIRFYANNPDHVALLSYIENKKLLARAVLWEAVDGKKYVDRIYCSSSKYGTKLAGYCKQKGYKTIHYSTSLEYGLEMSKDCVAQLNTFELKNSHYPYLDSMVYIDVVNNLLCPESQPISTYCNTLDKDYIIKNINRGGCDGGYDIYFGRNNKKGLKYLKDSKGQEIQDYLSRYAIIKKPKLSIVHRNDIITINGNEKVDGDWAEKVLIKRYNSLRPTLSYAGGNEYRYIIRYMDKQFVTYSNYHKLFVSKKESVFVPSINTYVLEKVIQSSNFQAYVKLFKLKKLYGGKLVRIEPGYLNCIKQQIAILPFKESLMDIRKSRVYSVSVKSILWNGIRIKGILIPFKHLRFVKR